MKILLFSAVLLCTASATAQQIDGYRYWFDDNLAGATTTMVAPTDELVLNTNLPTVNLSPGFHRMSVQVRDDNGYWTVPQTNYFVSTGGLVHSYRYWINDDISTMSTVPVSEVPTLQLISELAMTNQSEPFNWVTMQFMETEGIYSVPYTQAFVRGTGAVTGYEYWIDDAIDERVNNSIGPAMLVDLIDELPFGTTSGEHLFTIRFSSLNGTWSVPLSSTYTFITALEEIRGITDVLLFPNPATNQLSLRLNSDAPHTLHLEILDLTGRRVMNPAEWSVQGNGTRKWDIGGLAAGTYLMRISDGQGATNIPFIKL